MDGDDPKKPTLPEDKGQFGRDIESEAYERLREPPPASGPRPSQGGGAGENGAAKGP